MVKVEIGVLAHVVDAQFRQAWDTRGVVAAVIDVVDVVLGAVVGVPVSVGAEAGDAAIRDTDVELVSCYGCSSDENGGDGELHFELRRSQHKFRAKSCGGLR